MPVDDETKKINVIISEKASAEGYNVRVKLNIWRKEELVWKFQWYDSDGKLGLPQLKSEVKKKLKEVLTAGDTFLTGGMIIDSGTQASRFGMRDPDFIFDVLDTLFRDNGIIMNLNDFK